MTTRQTAGLLLASLGLTLSLGGCATQRPAGDTSGPALAPYTSAQILDVANQLVTKLELKDDQRTKLTGRLDKLLADPKFQPTLDAGITVVGAYRYGEGGFIIGGGSGTGYARFNGAEQDVRIVLGGVAFGFLIGGASTYGVFLGSGVDHASDLYGQFNSSGSSAVAGGAGGQRMKGTRSGSDVAIHTLSGGTGLGAGWGAGNFSIERRKNQEEAAPAGEASTADGSGD